MHRQYEAQLLRIFINEGDHHQGRPLHEAIVQAARKQGLAGATVLKGLVGYGAHARVHTAGVLRLGENLPLVIEIVDQEDRLKAFLPQLNELIGEGLATIEPVSVIAYRKSP